MPTWTPINNVEDLRNMIAGTLMISIANLTSGTYSFNRLILNRVQFEHSHGKRIESTGPWQRGSDY